MLDALTTEARTVTYDDLPWLLSLAYRRYRSFDPGKTLSWLVEVIRSPQALVLRDDDACCITVITTSPWHTPTESEAHVVFAFADKGKHWQLVRLLRQSVQWARMRGCKLWRCHSDTEYDVGVLAKRIGAKQAPQRWLIAFDGQ